MTVSELMRHEDQAITAPPGGVREEADQIESDLLAATSRYFEHFHALTLEELLSALDAEDSCGPDLRRGDVYAQIAEARRADDPSLPRGDWVRELKRADWQSVSQLAVQALSRQSKDLQVAAWLLESEIRLRGLAGVAPVLILLNRLSCEFWQQLNPPLEELELRGNIFYWIDQKIAPAINQVPLALGPSPSETFAGVDIDRALINERLVDTGQLKREQADGPSWAEVCSAAERMEDAFYQQAYWDAFFALHALSALVETLDRVFDAGAAPSLHSIEEQLQKAMEFSCMELERRGLLDQTQNPAPDADPQGVEGAQIESLTHHASTSTQDRQQAYAQLSQIAEFLIRIDPHSPVPYLLRRAVAWGRLNTAELYQQLFVENDGQINLFELLGISGGADRPAPHNGGPAP